MQSGSADSSARGAYLVQREELVGSVGIQLGQPRGLGDRTTVDAGLVTIDPVYSRLDPGVWVWPRPERMLWSTEAATTNTVVMTISVSLDSWPMASRNACSMDGGGGGGGGGASRRNFAADARPNEPMARPRTQTLRMCCRCCIAERRLCPQASKIYVTHVNNLV